MSMPRSKRGLAQSMPFKCVKVQNVNVNLLFVQNNTWHTKMALCRVCKLAFFVEWHYSIDLRPVVVCYCQGL